VKLISDGAWLFLVPGFVAIFVAGFISDFPTIQEAQLAITYVTVTIVCAAIPLAVAHVILRFRGERVELTRLVWRPWFSLLLFMTSVAFGFMLGFLHNTNRVSSALQTMFGPEIITIVSHGELRTELFSRSYGKGGANQRMWDGRPYLRHNTSSLYMRIIFRDEDRAYEGVAEKWSGRRSNPEVFLSPACEVEGESVTVIRGPGTWLSLEGVRQIQFIDDVCSPCATRIQIEEGATPANLCRYTDPEVCKRKKDGALSNGPEPGQGHALSGKSRNPVDRRRATRERR